MFKRANIIVPSEAKILSIASFVDLKEPDKMTYHEYLRTTCDK